MVQMSASVSPLAFPSSATRRAVRRQARVEEVHVRRRPGCPPALPVDPDEAVRGNAADGAVTERRRDAGGARSGLGAGGQEQEGARRRDLERT